MKSLRKANKAEKIRNVLDSTTSIIQKVWALPTNGIELGYSLSNTLRTRLELLIE